MPGPCKSCSSRLTLYYAFGQQWLRAIRSVNYMWSFLAGSLPSTASIYVGGFSQQLWDIDKSLEPHLLCIRALQLFIYTSLNLPHIPGSLQHAETALQRVASPFQDFKQTGTNFDFLFSPDLPPKIIRV